MDSFTQYYKNVHFSFGWRVLLRFAVLCVVLGSGAWVSAETLTEVSQFRVERVDDELQLSAQLQFELPAVVEDALEKGIPMVFVMDVEVLRERWYWYDKHLAGAQRQMRLVYQPLARRWRLNVGSGSGTVGLSLSQSFDTLAQALAAIKRVAKWKIADVQELDSAQKVRVEFHFQLDLRQLPRPFQLGAVGPSEWDIAATAQSPLVLENAK